MTIKPATFIILAVLAVITMVSVTILAGWWLLRLEPDLSETEARAQLTRLQASARTYYGRLHFYDGLCADIGVPKGFLCRDAEAAYAIEASIGGGSHLCFDSRGFSGPGRLDPDGAETCQR